MHSKRAQVRKKIPTYKIAHMHTHIRTLIPPYTSMLTHIHIDNRRSWRQFGKSMLYFDRLCGCHKTTGRAKFWERRTVPVVCFG